MARAISFIYDHKEELEVDVNDYSLWGGSAGARMAALVGNKGYFQKLTGRTDLQQASAVIMQYTGYSSVSSDDPPTYACVGTNGWNRKRFHWLRQQAQSVCQMMESQVIKQCRIELIVSRHKG